MQVLTLLNYHYGIIKNKIISNYFTIIWLTCTDVQQQLLCTAKRSLPGRRQSRRTSHSSQCPAEQRAMPASPINVTKSFYTHALQTF